MNYAICQELFEGWDWKRQCEFISQAGYTGIEVAPFTLATRPSEISAAKRLELRKIADANGLKVIGLHWLLAKTQGLHLTTADAATRRRTADYLSELTDLCADLGGTLMVFGSPQQRSLEAGMTPEQAFANAVEVFQAALPRLEDRGVDLLMEPLTTKETDFINTCDEAAQLIRAVGHPRFALHQDVKAMSGEGTPLPDIIRSHAGITRHFHANDTNLRGPGMGQVDFVPIFSALRDTGYDGWVSVEVFDYSPGAETTAMESIRYMQAIWNQVSQ